MHPSRVRAPLVVLLVGSGRFAPARIKDQISPGPELIIDGVEGDADLTEPWINADCTALYFGRSGKSWMALTVDDPTSGP